MNAIVMSGSGATPVSGYRILGWGASAVLHGGVLIWLLHSVPPALPLTPAPEIIPLEMALVPTAPAMAETEPTPAMEEAQAVAPEATSASQVPPPPLTMTAPEPVTAAQPPPPETMLATPPLETAPLPLPDLVQAVQPETQQPMAEPDVLPLEMADFPPPPPAPPPPPVQARTPTPTPPPPRPVPRQQARTAPEAAVAQPSEAPPGAMTAAPAPAASPQASPRRSAAPPADYVSRLSGALTRAKRYPQRARLRRIEGKPQVAFTIRRDGTVISATLIGSSGDADLDEEAVQLVHRASPLPAPPAEMTGDVVSVAMGLDFKLR